MARFAPAVSATLFTAALLFAVVNADAAVTAPQRSLRALGGRQVWVPLCSRRGVNGSAPYFDNVSTAVMDQQACLSPSWGTLSAVKLVFAAFDMPQQGEVDRPVTATGTSAIFVPGQNIVTATSGTGVASGSTVLNPFASTGLGVNGISLGQVVSSAWGGIAAGTYVTAVTNNFANGSGNLPTGTSVTISAGTTAATSNTQPFTFAGLFLPVKFGGKRNFILEPGHDVVTSDAAGLELPPNTWFMIRTAATMSGTGMQMMDVPASARITVSANSNSFTEFSNRGGTLNDQTLTPVALGNSGGGFWGPVSVLGLVTPTPGQAAPGAVLVLGDSIAAGSGDTPDAMGLEGYIQRSLENSVPFVSAARGSSTAAGLVAHGDGQYAMSVDTGITDVLLEPGRNDIQQFGFTASQVEGWIQAAATRYVNAGKRVWCFTIPPTTYSNDAWTSAANQSFPAAVDSTGAAAVSSGASQITMAAVAGIAVGQLVGLNGANNAPPQAIAPGTTVTAVNTGALTLTLSAPTVATIAAGTKLYFGTISPGAGTAEIQRIAFNNFARANGKSGSPYCSGLVDIDSVVADQAGTGKWRTDLGQASTDGVHPTAALHQAAVNAGLINPAMFAVP